MAAASLLAAPTAAAAATATVVEKRDAGDLEHAVQQFQSSLLGAASPGALSKALDGLRALGPLPVQLMVRTGVGKAVAALGRSAGDPAVRAQAKDLEEAWRGDFRKRGAKVSGFPAPALASPERPQVPAPALTPGPQASPKAAAVDGAASGAGGVQSGKGSPKEAERKEAPEAEKDGQRPSKKAKTSPVEADSRQEVTFTQRETVRRKLVESLGGEAPGLAETIELELFQSLSARSYMSQARSILHNLGDRSNHTFRDGVLSGSLCPAELTALSAEQMASAKKAAERAKVRELSLAEVQSDWDTRHGEQYDGMFTCPRCASQKTSYQQLQVGHGLDEPLTTFVSCLRCSNRWKFNDVGASEDADG